MGQDYESGITAKAQSTGKISEYRGKVTGMSLERLAERKYALKSPCITDQEAFILKAEATEF